MYAIQANVVIHSPRGDLSRQVPTFYLHENVQGITSEHVAKVVAEDILRSTMFYNYLTDIYISAVKV
jgi:hypothetical protein